MNSAQQIHKLIASALKQQNVSAKEMCISLDLKQNVMSNLKRGSMPSADKLALIANYIKLPIELLLGLNVSPNNVHVPANTKDEAIRKIALEAGLSEKSKEQLSEYVNLLILRDAKNTEIADEFTVKDMNA